jgi:hypothetical protein
MRRSLFVQTTLIVLLAVGSSARAQGPPLRDIPTNIALLDEAGALVDQLRAGRFHDVRRNVSERWALRPCA